MIKVCFVLFIAILKSNIAYLQPHSHDKSKINTTNISYFIGFSKRIETKFKLNTVLSSPDYNHYKYFSISRDSKKENYFSRFELNYVYKSLHIENSQYASVNSGSHGSVREQEWKYLYAKAKYSYFGLKYTNGVSVINKKRTNVSFGVFVQCDWLFWEKESNHYDSTIYKYESWTPEPFATYPDNNYYTKTTTNTSISEFDALTLNKIYFSFGLTLKSHFIFDKVIMEPYYSIGYNLFSRSYYKNYNQFYSEVAPSYKKHQLFNELGIKIGILKND